MNLIVILLSLLLGLIILGFEILRKKVKGKLDFTRMVSLIYFLAFVLVPIYINTVNLSYYSNSNFKWIFNMPFESINFIYASILSVIGYILIMSGFLVSEKMSFKFISPKKEKNLSKDFLSSKRLFVAGVLSGSIGLVSLIAYAASLGGITVFIELAGPLRSQISIETPYAFLKNVMPLVIISSYFFYALMKNVESRRNKVITSLLFFSSYLLSLLALYHQAGRLNLIVFILIFFVVEIVKINKVKIRYLIVGGFSFFFLILFGKELFHLAVDPNSLDRKLSTIQGENTILSDIIVEFSFPYITLAHAVESAGSEIGFRWFLDFPLGFLYMLPQRITNINLTETLSMLNTEIFNASGTIPIDLLSFGYYSAGILGIVLVTLTFGSILSLLNRIFPVNEEYITLIFRVAWMFFISFRIMYGDPPLSIKGSFYLVVGTMILIIMRNFPIIKLKKI